MNFKNLSRSLVCLLLVACMLVAVSPIRAQATGAGLAATWAAFAVAPEIAISAAMIALGVTVVAGSAAVLGGVVSECEQFLVENGYISGDLVDVYRTDADLGMQYMISRELVEVIRDWLFESGTVTESQVSVGSGLSGNGLNTVSEEIFNQWAYEISWYELVNSAKSGQTLVLAESDEIYNTGFWGIQAVTNPLTGDISLRCGTFTSIAPFTSASCPAGSFTDLNAVGTQYSSLFANYDVAYNRYLYAVNAGDTAGECYFFTENTYIERSGRSIFFRNLGSISYQTGSISYSSSLSYSLSWPNVVPLNFILEQKTVVSTDLNLNVSGVATLDKSFSDGYSEWASGTKSLPTLRNGEISDAESMYLSLGMADTLEDTMAMTQSQAQGGTITGSGTTSDTVTATGLKGWLDTIRLSIVDGFTALKDGFKTVIAALANLPTLIAGFFRTLASHFKSVFLLGSLLGVLGEYLQALFSWLPENMLAVLMLLFGVSIFYKFIGR